MMEVTPEQILATAPQLREQAEAEFIEGRVRRCSTLRPDAAARFETMRAISRRSAARLQGQEQFTDDDLYDGNGLPLLSKDNDFAKIDLSAAV